jgi:sulfur-carrier protein
VSVASVRLLAFAGARDVVGEPEVDLDLAGATTAAELFDLVVARYPGLVPYKGCIRLAINGSYAALGDPVRPGDEVALIPPVAGG